MQTSTLKLHSLSYNQSKTFLLALAFVAGNIILPQLCHVVPQGGFIFLPIYFFTLIASYKYGWRVGLLTAILSPVANHLLFSMPSAAVLPAILTKGVLLVAAASAAAHYFKRISLPILVGVVLSYQVLGSAIEWVMLADFNLAIQDFKLGIPGMLLQVLGAHLLINYFMREK
ncbi:MAG: ECF transporter S component [Rikenellaceae bacterium]